MKKKNIYYNFNRKNKWLGIIDYKSLLVIVIYIILVINAIRIFNISFDIAIYILIFATLPVIVIFTIDVNNETCIDMLLIILKFFINKRIYTNIKYVCNLSKERYCKFYKQMV